MCRTPSECASPTRRIEAGKRAAIHRLFELLRMKQIQEDATRDIFERRGWQILASVGSDAKSQEWATRAIVKLKEKVRGVSTADFLVSIYDKYFSAADIEVMISFFGTPTGQRYLEVQAQVVAESMTGGMQMAKQLAEECVTELLAERPELVPRPATRN